MRKPEHLLARDGSSTLPAVSQRLRRCSFLAAGTLPNVPAPAVAEPVQELQKKDQSQGVRQLAEAAPGVIPSRDFLDNDEAHDEEAPALLVLDGATSLRWGSTQEEGTEPVTQDLFREWMHIHSRKPKWVVADMAFFTPSNFAETAVSSFKRHYEKLLMDASTHPTLNKVTLRLIRECCSHAHLEACQSADL